MCGGECSRNGAADQQSAASISSSKKTAVFGGADANGITRAGQRQTVDSRIAPADGDADIHGAGRVALKRIGSGDAGEADADIRIAHRADVFSKQTGARLAHRPFCLKQRARYAKHLFFDAVCVADDTALHGLRRAGEGGELFEEKAAGQTFGRRDRPSSFVLTARASL